jgi:hypothetical protein
MCTGARTQREGQQATGSGLDRQGHLSQMLGGRGGRQHFAQVSFPTSPHTSGLNDPGLRPNSYLKVMVPKSTNITFWEQQKMSVTIVSKLLI